MKNSRPMSIHEQIKAARLKKEWSMERLAQEVSKAEKLAKPLAWQTVQQWEAGLSAPKRRRMETVASLLGLTIYELVSKHSAIQLPISKGGETVAAAGTVLVPRLDTTASFGSDEVEVIAQSLALSRDWVNRTLDSLTDVNSLRFLPAHGDSMEPTIKHGDVLLIDSGVRNWTADGVYVLEANKRLHLRRVRQRMDGGYEISGDNSTNKTVEVVERSRRLQVLGRAVWAWKGKKL
jgi:phage repressor protein C with HTH and peptisase S24 domain